MNALNISKAQAQSLPTQSAPVQRTIIEEGSPYNRVPESQQANPLVKSTDLYSWGAVLFLIIAIIVATMLRKKKPRK